MDPRMASRAPAEKEAGPVQQAHRTVVNELNGDKACPNHSPA